MVKTPNRAVIPPMNRPNPEMGVEVPKKQIKKTININLKRTKRLRHSYYLSLIDI
jgi:hypothetical protein